MKGDFTRSTFRPAKHYTSVRMQQGRLQLDSDWNEQADIQNYLRRAQVTDMIGSGSGASKVDPITGLPSTNNFQPCRIITALPKDPDSGAKPDASDQETTPNAKPEASDIALLPGHFYTNGVLCELAPGSLFSFAHSDKLAPNQLEILGSLTIDGRRLQVGDWLIKVETNSQNQPEAESQGQPDKPLQGWQITEIDTKTRVITVKGSLDTLLSKPGDTSEAGNPQVQAEEVKLRRVITYSSQPDFPTQNTSADLATLVPGNYLAYLDVWERHITAMDDPVIREVALDVPDTTTRTQTVWQLKLRPTESSLEPALAAKDLPGTSEDLPQDWQDFEKTERQRMPLMNARLSPTQGRGQSGLANSRLKNHLYRVEIHYDTGTNPGSQNTVSFKWSRDNGSVSSEILRIENGDTIRIPKSSQSIWENSTPGQWLEILTKAQELNGEPGIMVPLRRVINTKIEFDPSGLVGTLAPEDAYRVRRWDHTQNQFPQGSIPLKPGPSEWIELEDGIQVRFGQNESADTSNFIETAYRTGDYWQIPARAANNAIEWPTDQADDDVTLVDGQAATVSQPIAQPAQGVEHNYALIAIAEVDENHTISQVKDQRILFPPLLRALDRAGGTISGNLTIKKDLTVEQTTTTKDLKVSGKFAATNFRGKTFLIAPDPITDGTPNYGQIQAAEAGTQKLIEFSTVDQANFAFLNGDVEIGDNPPDAKLGVAGNVKVSETLDVQKATTLATAEGNVGIGGISSDAKLGVVGNAKISETLDVQKATNLALTEGNVGIGGASSDAKLGVTGNVKISETLDVQKGTNLALAEGNVGIGGTSSDAKLGVTGNAKISETLDVQKATNLALLEGNVGIGGFSADAKLGVTGNVKISETLDIQKATNLALTEGNVGIGGTSTDAKLGVTGDVRVSETLDVQKATNLALTEGNVGIGGISSDAKLGITGNVKVSETLDVQKAANLALIEGNVGIGGTSIDAKLGVTGNAKISETLDVQKATNLALTEGNVGIGGFSTDAKLGVTGNVKVSETLDVQKATALAVTEGNVAIGATSTDAKLGVTGNVTVSETLDVQKSAILATQAGNVCIGAEAPSESASAAKLYVNGDLYVDSDSAEGGKLFAKNIAVENVESNGFVQLSSIAIKDDVTDLSGQEVAEALAQLRPVKFKYKVSNDDGFQAGFLAEEVPELLATDNQQGVKLMDVIAVLTKAVQENRKVIKQLSKMVTDQNKQITQLQQALQSRQSSSS